MLSRRCQLKTSEKWTYRGRRGRCAAKEEYIQQWVSSRWEGSRSSSRTRREEVSIQMTRLGSGSSQPVSLPTWPKEEVNHALVPIFRSRDHPSYHLVGRIFVVSETQKYRRSFLRSRHSEVEEHVFRIPPFGDADGWRYVLHAWGVEMKRVRIDIRSRKWRKVVILVLHRNVPWN